MGWEGPGLDSSACLCWEQPPAAPRCPLGGRGRVVPSRPSHRVPGARMSSRDRDGCPQKPRARQRQGWGEKNRCGAPGPRRRSGPSTLSCHRGIGGVNAAKAMRKLPKWSSSHTLPTNANKHVVKLWRWHISPSTPASNQPHSPRLTSPRDPFDLTTTDRPSSPSPSCCTETRLPFPRKASGTRPVRLRHPIETDGQILHAVSDSDSDQTTTLTSFWPGHSSRPLHASSFVVAICLINLISGD